MPFRVRDFALFYENNPNVTLSKTLRENDDYVSGAVNLSMAEGASSCKLWRKLR